MKSRMTPFGTGTSVLCVSMLMISASHAQSLGEIAKQQRERNKQQVTHSSRVLTNEDLGNGSNSGERTPAASPDQKRKASAHAGQSDENNAPSADEFSSKIQHKKQTIAEIEDRIAKLQSTINYVQNNRNIYANAPEYNEEQKRKEQEVSRLKGVLQQQQDELQELQDRARKAGYGNAVYD